MGNGVRFAPSPTGVFHLGNLRTAWISHWWARGLGLPWVVRFEDIDEPRVVRGAREQQLADLAKLGLVPDKEYLQTDRRARHLELFTKAKASGQIYPCYCSRKEIQDAIAGLASAPHAAPAIYNGQCREIHFGQQKTKNPTIAWRFRGSETTGRQDFIVARTDPGASEASFVPAYGWACAIDDIDGGYELLVRATDLAHALEHQRAVQAWVIGLEKLAKKFPAVFHAALVTQNDGARLEKRTQGVTLAELEARGISARELGERFQKSFREKTANFSAGRVWDENPAYLFLSKIV